MSKQEHTNGESTDDEQQQPMAITPGRGPNRDDMTADYLPESEDWLAKTQLDLNDPQAVAALKQFHRMFPEVDDLQPIIDEFTSDFMKGRTSVGGDSRSEYRDIIMSMFGGNPSTEDKAFAAIAEGLGADDDD